MTELHEKSRKQCVGIPLSAIGVPEIKERSDVG